MNFGPPPAHADKQETPVVEKLRLFALEGMADELERPSHKEKRERIRPQPANEDAGEEQQRAKTELPVSPGCGRRGSPGADGWSHIAPPIVRWCGRPAWRVDDTRGIAVRVGQRPGLRGVVRGVLASLALAGCWTLAYRLSSSLWLLWARRGEDPNSETAELRSDGSRERPSPHDL